MPLPVCPDGSPYIDLPPEEEEMPGASPLDAGLRRLEGMLDEGRVARPWTKEERHERNNHFGLRVATNAGGALPDGVIVLKGPSRGRPAKPRQSVSREAQRIGGGHPGGVGRRSHADRRRRRDGHLRAAILPLGTTGLGGLRIGLRATAAGQDTPANNIRSRSFRRRSFG